MRPLHRQLPVLGLLLATGGCQLFNDCELILRPGIAVTVLDSVSGEPLPAGGARVVVIDGIFADNLVAEPDGRYVGLSERPGVYRVEVTSPGYSTWVRQGVEVGQPRDCPQTTELTALIQPTE